MQGELLHKCAPALWGKSDWWVCEALTSTWLWVQLILQANTYMWLTHQLCWSLQLCQVTEFRWYVNVKAKYVALVSIWATWISETYYDSDCTRLKCNNLIVSYEKSHHFTQLGQRCGKKRGKIDFFVSHIHEHMSMRLSKVFLSIVHVSELIWINRKLKQNIHSIFAGMSGIFTIQCNHLSVSDMKQGFAEIKLQGELKLISIDMYTTRCILTSSLWYTLWLLTSS